MFSPIQELRGAVHIELNIVSTGFGGRLQLPGQAVARTCHVTGSHFAWTMRANDQAAVPGIECFPSDPSVLVLCSDTAASHQRKPLNAMVEDRHGMVRLDDMSDPEVRPSRERPICPQPGSGVVAIDILGSKPGELRQKGHARAAN